MQSRQSGINAQTDYYVKEFERRAGATKNCHTREKESNEEFNENERTHEEGERWGDGNNEYFAMSECKLYLWVGCRGRAALADCQTRIKQQ